MNSIKSLCQHLLLLASFNSPELNDHLGTTDPHLRIHDYIWFAWNSLATQLLLFAEVTDDTPEPIVICRKSVSFLQTWRWDIAPYMILIGARTPLESFDWSCSNIWYHLLSLCTRLCGKQISRTGMLRHNISCSDDEDQEIATSQTLEHRVSSDKGTPSTAIPTFLGFSLSAPLREYMLDMHLKRRLWRLPKLHWDEFGNDHRGETW